MRSRVLRLSAASLLLGAAVTTIAPHVTNYISTSAIVNAPILAVRAPFPGLLTEASPAFASPVQAGQPLLRIDGERQDQDGLVALQAEVRATQSEIEALAAQIASVSGLEADLRRRIAAHDRAAGRYLAAERQSLQARADSAVSAEGQAEAERDRVAILTANGAAPHLSLEEAEAQARSARLATEAALAELRALDVRLESLSQGAAFDPTLSAGAYAHQRLDEVTLLKAQLASRRDTLRGRLAALDRQVATVSADFLRRTAFLPRAAAPAVVWRGSPPEGTSIMAGDTLVELLDCRNRFIEVALPARLSGEIRPGDPAIIQLKGASEAFQARVEAVGGAGARFDHPNLASDPVDTGPSDIQVLIWLDPVDPNGPGVAATFCDVGKTAEVRFARQAPKTLSALAAAFGALGAWGRSLASDTPVAGESRVALGPS